MAIVPGSIEYKAAVKLSYRHLYQTALRAVKYSKPARYTIRDRLRWAFRKSPANSLDPIRIRNTLAFLYHAQKSKSLEHRVLRTLLFTWHYDWAAFPAKLPDNLRSKVYGPQEHYLRSTTRDQFNHTVRMLNESMGMCIK